MYKKISILLTAVALSASMALHAQPNKKKLATAKPKKPAQEKVYDKAHTPPKAPMDDAGLWRYFAEKAGSTCQMATFNLQCIVNTDGSLSDVKLKEKVTPECLKKIKQAAAKLPRWKPGRNAAGKAIRVRYSVKIYFPVDAPPTEVLAFPREGAENGPAYADAGEGAFETQPEFPDRNSYIRQNLIYPEAALKAGTYGQVPLKLTIDTNGKVLKVQALKELPNGCTEEAVRLAENMPVWKPGTQRGKPVKMNAYMVVRFALPVDHPGNKALDSVQREGGLWGETGHNVTSLPLPNQKPFPKGNSSGANRGIHHEEPKFPGDLQKYISDSLRYPPAARAAGLQGEVIIGVMVWEDGNLRGFRVEKSLSKECDEEALRLFRSMPKWEPAKADGKPMPVKINVPVKFELN